MHEYRYQCTETRVLYVKDGEDDPKVPRNWRLMEVRKVDMDATGGR